MSEINIYTVVNRTGSAVQLMNSDYTATLVSPGSSVTVSLDDAQYVEAVSIFGVANVTVAASAAGGLEVTTISAPDLSPPGVSTGGSYSQQTIVTMQAVLAELRVISNLLNMNSQNADLMVMRSDEYNSAVGGAIN